MTAGARLDISIVPQALLNASKGLVAKRGGARTAPSAGSDYGGWCAEERLAERDQTRIGTVDKDVRLSLNRPTVGAETTHPPQSRDVAVQPLPSTLFNSKGMVRGQKAGERSAMLANWEMEVLPEGPHLFEVFAFSSKVMARV
ncbi:hypothetical protein A0H81_14453 [Grifola frondosa]|uniref:Uncharacterized protein n=1 Tax=Grifola frondosa TaxID=5627 RepID=A0A1C7LNT9_GRIFR|nr:hypothetical protein A0H81_14453 [Grifola frondosa]